MTDIMCVDHTSIAMRDTYKYLVSKINDSRNIQLLGESISLAKGEPTHIDTVFSVDYEIEVTMRQYVTENLFTVRVVVYSISYFPKYPTDSAVKTYAFRSMFSVPESAKEKLMSLISRAAAR